MVLVTKETDIELFNPETGERRLVPAGEPFDVTKEEADGREDLTVVAAKKADPPKAEEPPTGE